MFQWLYNFFRKLRFPAWLRPYIQNLNDIMLAVLKKAGEDYIEYLKALIIEAARNKDFTARQKFEYVYKNAKSSLAGFAITLKDSEINVIIEYLVQLLKKQGVA